ncbi:hypothetical protein C2S52_002462 [Perilla frutescens var. hirtella]|nr:hypothetical protein C2S52_002462 [Perilla frutescens var. hirtella]
MSVSNKRETPHLVFLPSGIGNLSPFFRLAVVMASSNCKVTFINVQSEAVDPDFANHPGVEVVDFEMQAETSSNTTISDPFIARVASINRALYRLSPILASLQVSAIFSDFAVAATLAQISDDLNIPLCIVSTTSALFFALVTNLPLLLSQDSNLFSNSTREIDVQGMPSIPKTHIPAAWLHNSSKNHLLTAYLLPNARALPKVKGVLLNSFNWFEQETLAALNCSRALQIFPVGPLPTYEQQKGHHLPWLSEQPAQSVVYVDFGSQEVISPDQIREVKKGLEISGFHYLWVTEFAGESCFERSKKGIIISGGVDQERVLADPAIGVFVNQCEWQSIMQAAWEGVPMLAWPQHGDQKMNAEAIEKTGLGIWMKEWSSGGEELIDGNEIGRQVGQMMEDMNIKKAAKFVRERAREACENGGSSQKAFNQVVQMFTSSKN